MYERGIVIGKFCPPTRGHGLLIERALAECRSVTVLLADSPTYSIPVQTRLDWLQALHPQAIVRTITVGSLDDADSLGWAAHTVRTLGYVPDAVFTSEAYGDPYAAAMGCAHVLVDLARIQVPISATLVRADPWANAQYLNPLVRAYFVKRVVIVGAESCGKTTLARSLAEHYATPWVPEYGRTYSEGRGLALPWRTDEFVHIASMQNQMEDTLACSATRLLICDTDAFATSIWHERYVGTRSDEVLSYSAGRHPVLYLVPAPDIGFVQDGLRDGEHLRTWMHARFIGALSTRGDPFQVITGERAADRLAQAVSAIEPLL